MKTAHRNFAVTAAAALTCALAIAATARAAEIKVVTSGTFRATNCKLVTEFGSSLGTTYTAIPVRLDRGEPIDVVIMFAPALSDLIKRGEVRTGSAVDLVQSRIGMAVRAGAPKPASPL